MTRRNFHLAGKLTFLSCARRCAVRYVCESEIHPTTATVFPLFHFPLYTQLSHIQKFFLPCVYFTFHMIFPPHSRNIFFIEFSPSSSALCALLNALKCISREASQGKVDKVWKTADKLKIFRIFRCSLSCEIPSQKENSSPPTFLFRTISMLSTMNRKVKKWFSFWINTPSSTLGQRSKNCQSREQLIGAAIESLHLNFLNLPSFLCLNFAFRSLLLFIFFLPFRIASVRISFKPKNI